MDPRLLRLTLAAFLFLPVISVRAQTLDWVAQFDDLATGREAPRSAAFSSSGDLHILAEHSDGFVYFRVDGDGKNVCETRFAVPNQPYLLGPAIDQTGGAYLAQRRYGHGSEPDFAILRLGESDDQWTLGIHDDPNDRDNLRHALVIDAAGNAIVAGASRLTSPDIRLLTVCFGPDARVRWAARYEAAQLVRFEAHEGGGVRATADADGNTYVAALVTGADSDTDTLLVKYDSQGQEVWARRFDIDATSGVGFWPGALVINGNGEIVVCGPSAMPRGFATARFDANGNDLGHTFTPLTGMSAKYVTGACVNPVDGGFFVAVTVQRSTFWGDLNFGLFRYSAAGELIYFSTFNGSEHSLDTLSGLYADAEGRAYLGGSTIGLGSPQELWALQVLPDGTAGWSTRYSTVSSDRAGGFLRDSLGRPTLVGSSFGAHTGTDAVTVQMNPDGIVESERHFNTTVRSWEWGMHGVVVADSGDVYVCGNSGQYPDSGELVTIKYDSSGIEQWRRRVADMGSSGFQLGLRAGHHPQVLGWVSGDESYDARNVILIEYFPDGRESWRLEYDGPGSNGDSPLDMVQDVAGNRYVLIRSSVSEHYVQVLLKVDASGRIVWERFADGFGYGPLAVDTQGNVFLSGPGLTLAKFTSAGVLDWIEWRESSSDCDEHAQAMAVGTGGHVIVAGETCTAGSQGALAVVKFAPDGELVWHVENSDSPGRSTATHLAIDAAGEIYVSGVEIAGGYRTLLGRVSPQGQLRWLARHQLGTGSLASSIGIALDGIGHVYSAGSQASQLDDPDYLLLRYDLDGNLVWRASYGLIDGEYDLAGALVIDTANHGAAYLFGKSSGGTTHGDFVTLRYGPAPAPCAACRIADTNHDCRVDLADLGAVLANFGAMHVASVSPADGDLNFDGVTDLADLAGVLSAFGADCQ